MLILKIMSNQDLADDDPRKEFKLVAGVKSVSFYHQSATSFEKSQLGFVGEGDLEVSFARCTVFGPHPMTGIECSTEETYLLTGNCYVLNDRGKTIESFWARRNPQGAQVGEK